jgi:hypothetical protein
MDIASQFCATYPLNGREPQMDIDEHRYGLLRNALFHGGNPFTGH